MTQIKDIAITKTVADDADYLVLQSPLTGETYKITKADLLAGLSSSESGGGSNGGSTPIGFPTDMKFWLEGGSLLDKSGNNNHASSIGNAPSVVNSTDNKPALKWDGSGTQELQVSPFLAGTNGATLYCVFTASNGNYNLARTSNLDDYWRFVGGGYFGTFRNSRFENYPAFMPTSGSHLISIHAEAGYYDILLNNASQGFQAGNYTPGDRFRIGANDKAFSGDISLMLVYPRFISKTFKDHTDIIAVIKSKYPSLTLSS